VTPKDVQNQRIEGGFKLTRVGVTGVKKPVNVHRNGRDLTLTATFDLFVDLPSEQRGSHMSRNLEVVGEIVDESLERPVSSIEDLAADITKRLLEKHEYASCAEAVIRADYFMDKRTPMGRKTIEAYKIEGHAINRKGEIERYIGVEVIGMSACPCAMETLRAMLIERYPEYERCISEIPIITHNQRNVVTIKMQIPDGKSIEAEDLINIAEDSLSSPTFEVLKRDDEGKVVYEAHINPKFVEDVVRDALHNLLKRYPDFPDDTKVIVKSESEESIHKHNAFAERTTTLGELRE
jgi:GTP cyclohydrolase-4